MSHNPTENPNRLLVADAHGLVREFIAATGAKLGYLTVLAADDAQLRGEFARISPTVIVLDPNGLGMAAVDLFSWLALQHCRAAIVLASDSEDRLLTALQEMGLAYGLDVTVVLKKPLTDESLDAALGPQVIRRHLFTERDLRRAVDRAQLRVHYQPKVCAEGHSWRVTGIEALLRWEHPDYGLIYPDQFIALAEEHGLIAGLTDFVLQAGIEQVSEWNRAGLRLNLSVNLSPKLVTDADFPERMEEFLRARGVAPEQLTLEITETAALVDPGHTVDILARLREKRIGLSLDDFGTGYSPLTQVYKLPLSEVKIDRSIGMELPHKEPVRMIVRAMIDLGHNLGLKVCCEGVENASALDFLHQAGCDSAQGYYIARPMAELELAEWLAGANPWSDAALRQAS